MQKIIYFILLMTVSFDQGVAAGKTIRPDDLYEWSNVVQLEEGLIGGGKPDERILQKAAHLGVRTIIDLRTAEEGTAEERERVESLGMKYVNIPLSGRTLATEAADALALALSDPESRPAIVHCNSGNRVGALWALYLNRHRDLGPAEALSAGQAKGLRNASLIEKVQRLLRSSPEN